MNRNLDSLDIGIGPPLIHNLPPSLRSSLPVGSYLSPLSSSKHEMTARESTRDGGQQLTESATERMKLWTVNF